MKISNEQLTDEGLITKENKRMLKLLERLLKALAHDMRNLLCIISLNVERIETSGAPANTTEARANVELAVKRSSTIIDMFLVKIHYLLKDNLKQNSYQVCSMKSALETLLAEYPFYESELQRLFLAITEKCDFNYWGDALLTKHVLFNLMSNALKAIKEAGEGEIYVEAIPGADYNRLIFRDTASKVGQSPKVDNIFSPSLGKHGLGLGLPFCKLVMESYGGRITCSVLAGEYTEFSLYFPALGS